MRTSSARRHGTLVAAVILTVVSLAHLGAVRTARAAFPGRNGQIAFTVTQSPFAEIHDAYHTLKMVTDRDIFTVSPSTGAIRQVTSGTDIDYDPAWSPDGRTLAFTRADPTYGRAMTADIFVTEGDGSNLTNLTSTTEFMEVMPAWSPDGKQIIFTSDRATPDLIWRTSDVIAGDTDLWIMDADGQNLRRLTSDEGAETNAAWSSRGWIAFETNAELFEFPNYTNTLSVMRSDGSHRQILVNDGSSPSWSPDGTRIAYRAACGGIWVVNADGSGRKRLVRSESGCGSPPTPVAPVWSPNGKEIAFLSTRDGTWKLYKMTATGRNITELVGLSIRSPHGGPDWGPRA